MYFHYPNQILPGWDVDPGGEAMQFGLVDVCDVPYEQFLRHIVKTNKRLNDVHAGTVLPVSRRELGLP